MTSIDERISDESTPDPEPVPEPSRYRYYNEAQTKCIDYATMEAVVTPANDDILPYDIGESAWFAALDRRRRGEAALRQAERKMAAESAPLSDVEMEAVAAVVAFDAWTAGATYQAGKRLTHDGQLYEVIQSVTAQTHQPPDAEGMLAIYRPVDGAAGTADDPKRFILGMDVVAGCHYRYQGDVWVALMSFLAHAGRQPDAPELAAFWKRAEQLIINN